MAITLPFSLFPYAISFYAWDTGNPLILIGDYHAPGKMGLAHYETVKKRIEHWASKHQPVTFLLEESIFPQNKSKKSELKQETLTDLVTFSQSKNNQYNTVQFVAADYRNPLLIKFVDMFLYPFFYDIKLWSKDVLGKECSSLEEMEKNVAADFSKIKTKFHDFLALRFGTSVTKEKLLKECENLLLVLNQKSQIDSVNNKELVKECMDTFNNLKKQLEQIHSSEPLIETVSSLFEQKKSFIEVYNWYLDHIQPLHKVVADLGFIVEIAKQKKSNTPCILWTGDAHLEEVNRWLTKLENKNQIQKLWQEKTSGYKAIDTTRLDELLEIFVPVTNNNPRQS